MSKSELTKRKHSNIEHAYFTSDEDFLKHFMSETWEPSSDEFDYSDHTPLTNVLFHLAIAIDLSTDSS